MVQKVFSEIQQSYPPQPTELISQCDILMVHLAVCTCPSEFLLRDALLQVSISPTLLHAALSHFMIHVQRMRPNPDRYSIAVWNDEVLTVW